MFYFCCGVIGVIKTKRFREGFELKKKTNLFRQSESISFSIRYNSAYFVLERGFLDGQNSIKKCFYFVSDWRPSCLGPPGWRSRKQTRSKGWWESFSSEQANFLKLTINFSRCRAPGWSTHVRSSGSTGTFACWCCWSPTWSSSPSPSPSSTMISPQAGSSSTWSPTPSSSVISWSTSEQAH